VANHEFEDEVLSSVLVVDRQVVKTRWHADCWALPRLTHNT